MVISNGFHEDMVLGEDKELMRWLYSNPEHKKKLEEFLAFADTGVTGFRLDKRSDGVDVSSQHGNPFFIEEMDSGLHSYITQLIVDIFRNQRINRYDGTAE
jgi:hypothetical protein